MTDMAKVENTTTTRLYIESDNGGPDAPVTVAQVLDFAEALKTAKVGVTQAVRVRQEPGMAGFALLVDVQTTTPKGARARKATPAKAKGADGGKPGRAGS